MANEKHFTAGNGALWIQPDGPGTDMVFLGCHDVASIEEPLGDYTPFFCPDPSQPKRFVKAGESNAPPEATTTQIVEDVVGSLSVLEDIECPFGLYINMLSCGRKDVFTNYQKTYIVDVQKVTNRSYANMAMRESDERAEITHDLSGSPGIIKIIDVAALQLTIPAATGGGA